MTEINESVVIPYTNGWRDAMRHPRMPMHNRPEDFAETLVNDIATNVRMMQESNDPDEIKHRELERYFRQIAMRMRRAIDQRTVDMVMESLNAFGEDSQWISDMFMQEVHRYM